MIENGQVAKAIASFPVSPSVSRPSEFELAYRRGEVDLELVPQGTLAERLRAGGAGIHAFYTPTGVGTLIAEGKESRTIDGRDYILEYGLRADFAIIRAHKADTNGNLIYRGTSRNFNAVMAPAARVTIVEVDEIVEPGQLNPEEIVHARCVRATDSQTTRRFHGLRIAEGTSSMTADKERLDRAIIAMRVARELPPGGTVNLGIGIPTLVSMFVADDSIVFYHSESGVLNCGPLAEDGNEDIDLINAGGQFLEPVPGMAYFSSADAFAMIRGGHVDVTVLGAHQVSAQGDLANWMLPDRGVGNIGGAMDLAAGADKVIVAMEHNDRGGNPKVVEDCTFPLTGKGCVSLVVTDVAVLEPTGDGWCCGKPHRAGRRRRSRKSPERC